MAHPLHPHPQEDLPDFLSFAMEKTISPTTMTRRTQMRVVARFAKIHSSIVVFLSLGVRFPEQQEQEEPEYRNCRHCCEGEGTFRNQQAEAVDTQGHRIGEQALICNGEGCPFAAHHFTADCSHCSKAGCA